MKIKLETSEFSKGLAETYENAALKAGFKIDAHTQYDCRYICIAENIQDTWIKYYSGWMREQHPHISEVDIKCNIAALLLMCGAKVEKTLGENEVMLEKGFLVSD